VHQVGDPPRLYYDAARSTNHQDVEQLSDKINSVTCTSCWDLYIRIFVTIDL